MTVLLWLAILAGVFLLILAVGAIVGCINGSRITQQDEWKRDKIRWKNGERID